MTLLLQILARIGWQGAIAAGVGAVLAGGAAYPVGRFVERQVCDERVARRLSEHELKHMEVNNARMDAALAARRRADRTLSRGDDGRLPDDGYRRD